MDTRPTVNNNIPIRVIFAGNLPTPEILLITPDSL